MMSFIEFLDMVSAFSPKVCVHELHACRHTHTRTCTHTLTHTHKCTHTQTGVHTHAHTHTHKTKMDKCKELPFLVMPPQPMLGAPVCYFRGTLKSGQALT